MAKKATLNRNANANALNSSMVSEDIYVSGRSHINEPFLMDVSDAGHAEILDELTDLSSNKGAYVIREAYSNAHDATVRLGDMSRPIEITIPDIAWRSGSLAEKLALANGTASDEKVQYAYVTDHGIGMTEYDLRTYFTQYGGSDKRGLSESVGSKGLGSKAPLAVSDYFDVITCKDGVRTTMHLWRGEGGNYAEITGSTPCDADETGTSIRIPVTDPTVASQMMECANEIAARNTDAVIVVNERRQEGHFGKVVGQTYAHKGTSYTYIGEIDIARSSDGSMVSLPTWVASSVLTCPELLAPRDGFAADRISNSTGVDINLCGVGYPLVLALRNSDSQPAYVVEIQPGYLNFTVSRDEIKEDAAKQSFVKCLSDALDETNLWPFALLRVAHDFDQIAQLFGTTSGANVSFGLVDGKWMVATSHEDWENKSGYVLTDEDTACLMVDGKDIRPLLATYDGNDLAGHKARAFGYWSTAYNGKSPRFHGSFMEENPLTRSKSDPMWPTDQLPWTWGTSRSVGSHGQNSYGVTVDDIRALVGNLPLCDVASMMKSGLPTGANVAVIGGVASDSDIDAFAKSEHSIRRHFARLADDETRTVKLMYVLCEDAVASIDDLSDAEQALVGMFGGVCEVGSLGEVIETCRREDKENRTARTRKRVPNPLGTWYGKVVPIDHSKFADEESLLTIRAQDDRLPKPVAQDIDCDTLGTDDLVVLGRPSDHEVVRIAVTVMLLQKRGLLDASHDRILFVPCTHDGHSSQGMYAQPVKRLARNVMLLGDLREAWAVNRLPNVLDMTQGVSSDRIDIDALGILPEGDVLTVASKCDPYQAESIKVLVDAGLDCPKDMAGIIDATAGTVTNAPIMRVDSSSPEVVWAKAWIQSALSVANSYLMGPIISSVKAGDEDSQTFMRALLASVGPNIEKAADKALTEEEAA